MRNIKFSELKLKNADDENLFYDYYLKTLSDVKREKKITGLPVKKYEIFYLNIIDGKIILLDSNYIEKEDTEDQEIYYDYSIAYKIYQNLLDIEAGIRAEEQEGMELYREEKLRLAREIEDLKIEDEKRFQRALIKNDIIKKSPMYNDYLNLKEENEKLDEDIEILSSEIETLKQEIESLKLENEKLKENIKLNQSEPTFLEKIYGKLFNKRLSK